MFTLLHNINTKIPRHTLYLDFATFIHFCSFIQAFSTDFSCWLSYSIVVFCLRLRIVSFRLQRPSCDWLGSMCERDLFWHPFWIWVDCIHLGYMFSILFFHLCYISLIHLFLQNHPLPIVLSALILSCLKATVRYTFSKLSTEYTIICSWSWCWVLLSETCVSYFILLLFYTTTHILYLNYILHLCSIVMV